MTRMLLTMVVGFAAAGSARADWGGSNPPIPNPQYPVQPIRSEFTAPNTLMGLGHIHDGRAPDRYGLMPGLRKAFRMDGSNGGCSTCNGGKTGLGLGLLNKGGCSTCGNGFGHGKGGGYEPYQYPPMMQGTLVFPNNPYTRSPRDFFMYEPGR